MDGRRKCEMNGPRFACHPFSSEFGDCEGERGGRRAGREGRAKNCTQGRTHTHTQGHHPPTHARARTTDTERGTGKKARKEAKRPSAARRPPARLPACLACPPPSARAFTLRPRPCFAAACSDASPFLLPFPPLLERKIKASSLLATGTLRMTTRTSVVMFGLVGIAKMTATRGDTTRMLMSAAYLTTTTEGQALLLRALPPAHYPRPLDGATV